MEKLITAFDTHTNKIYGRRTRMRHVNANHGYLTKDNIIIFGPNYAERLDPQFLSQFNKIIFSQYGFNSWQLVNYELLFADRCYKKNAEIWGLEFDQIRVDICYAGYQYLVSDYSFVELLLNKSSITHLALHGHLEHSVVLDGFSSLTHLAFDIDYEHPLKLEKNTNAHTFGFTRFI